MKKLVLCLLASPLLTSTAIAATAFQTQQQLDTFAAQARFEMAVQSNFVPEASKFAGQLRLTLPANVALPAGTADWQIYFHSIRKIDHLQQHGLQLEHVQGDLHRITPTKAFAGLLSGQALTLNFTGAPWIVSYSDFMPRAFLVAGRLKPAVFANTDTEQLQQFVAPITSQAQQLRNMGEPDLFPIADTQSRYQANLAVNQAKGIDAADLIMPTPQQIKQHSGRTELNNQWSIRFQGGVKTEAAYLTNRLAQAGLALRSEPGLAPGKQQIRLQIDPTIQSAEGYQLLINAEQIEIRGRDNAGVFYGVQSLLALTPAQFSSYSLPRVSISDAPRYSWRGMHYDMGRNFHGKAVTLQLIEQMARYKLNKLHLHLTEDEGWRLEIPGLPELTEIGAFRCFDLTEQQCLLTQLGSGPHKTSAGNGYYTKDDFVEILKFAAERHIEVIPEIDMPGHARAAIKAMEVRYQRLQKQGKTAEAKQYLLSDPADKSRYMTVQNYTDNSVNVCMDSSYAFIDKVIYELQSMYRQAGVRLTTYHMGGDEVGVGSWTGSPECQALFAKGEPGIAGVDDLKPYFVSRVADLLHKRQLTLGGWEDGLMYDKITPFNREQLAARQVYANVWDNIWEWGVSDRAYRLANAGYQVVLSHGTHLYFDHPNEAHPQERGYYWAARYTDAAKVFGYMPDDVYANADRTRSGAEIKDLEQLVGRPLPALEKPENILGIQGQVWTETIRTAQQLEEMVYPRLLPLAERAWHKARWEGQQPDAAKRLADWQRFAHLMTQKELPRLSKAGVQYYLPPVGAVIEGGVLKANTAYPGLTIQYSLDNGQSWLNYQEGIAVGATQPVLLRSKAVDGRTSRQSQLN